jgi:actin related protein 2/3 complex subunit 1A/1B
MACFAWNKDQSKIAICPNSSEIWVFKTNNKPNDSTKWERIQVLKEVSD